MRYALAALLLLIAWPADAQKTNTQLQTEITTNLPSGQPSVLTAAALRGVLSDMVNASNVAAAINVTLPPHNASCNGSTDDSAAFTNAIAGGFSILIPADKTCIVKNITIADNQVLNCQGSTLKTSSTANWIVKKTGFNSGIVNCQLSDTGNFTKISTTLASGASAGSSTISVTSAAGLVTNQAIAILLDSGAYWLTKITNVAGTTITLADAIPASQAVTPTVSAGGSNYNVGDKLVVQGGTGAPITVHVATVSGTAVNTVTLDAPGLYSSFPSSPAATLDANAQTASGATLTITSAAASSGNTVEATWGTLVIDIADSGLVSNVIFGAVPAGIHILNSTASTSFTAQETIKGVVVNSFQLFALMKDVGVGNTRVSDFIAYGTTHNSSSYGVAGVYINGDSAGSAPTGGNLFRGVNILNAETAWLDNAGQLDMFTQTLGDTTRNYGFVCNACTGNTWGGGTWMQFSGPNAISGTAGFGGGMYFGNTAINNVLEGLQTANNAFDVHIADSASSIWLNGQAWGSSKAASGNTASFQSGQTLFSASSPSSVGGSGATIYLGASGYATTALAVNAINAFHGIITQFSCASTSAPGIGQNYACNLLDNGNVLGSCSYSGGSSFSCTYTGPGIIVLNQDRISLQIVSSGGAASNQFRGYVAGM